ncbi:MAG: CoA ester lyase [Rhodospirillaceae bacterium]|nr:CoA ester lyase [Rhodospirillaceae bacterium]HAA91702.1 CoA ester lyase [Rhodospirillaceae bacterium]
MTDVTTKAKEGLVLRSMMFVPVNVDKYVEKAHTRGPDAMILDLEDSIAASEKATARTLVTDAAKVVSQKGADVFVRINSPLRLGIPDLEAVIGPGIRGITLPKCDGPGHVRLIAEAISELEAERGVEVGSTIMSVRVETAEAYFKMAEIAKAHPRIACFGLGSEDFTLSIGVEPSTETLLFPKQQSIIAARAAGVLPMGLVSSGADYTRLDEMREVVKKSRRFGFAGSSCIHPAVVPILNEEFTPPEEEVENARKIIDAFDEAVKAGRASLEVDGKMVDYPIVYRAENLIKIADNIAKKTAAAQ